MLVLIKNLLPETAPDMTSREASVLLTYFVRGRLPPSTMYKVSGMLAKCDVLPRPRRKSHPAGQCSASKAYNNKNCLDDVQENDVEGSWSIY